MWIKMCFWLRIVPALLFAIRVGNISFRSQQQKPKLYHCRTSLESQFEAGGICWASSKKWFRNLISFNGFYPHVRSRTNEFHICKLHDVHTNKVVHGFRFIQWNFNLNAKKSKWFSDIAVECFHMFEHMRAMDAFNSSLYSSSSEVEMREIRFIQELCNVNMNMNDKVLMQFPFIINFPAS